MTKTADTDVARVRKSDREWREGLTPEQFRVARKGGTERAFSGEYWATKEDGSYLCVCCGQDLFESSAKFDSGTEWPSFTQPAAGENVDEKEDRKFFMRRTEVVCSRCDAHLGSCLSGWARSDRTALLRQLGCAELRAAGGHVLG